MKRVVITAIAVACLSVSANAAPMCGLPLASLQNVSAGQEAPKQLNNAVAMAFLDQFNNTGPLTSYQTPVWVIDNPQDNVIEVIATSEGQGCAFVAQGHLRDVIMKMLYGETM